MVMRVFAAILTVLLGTGSAFGQATETVPPAKPAIETAKPATKPKPKPKVAAKPTPTTVPRADAPATTGTAPDAKPEETTAKPSVKDSYAVLTLNERLSIQSDLVWTGDYNGLINGEFSDRLVASVKAFQKRNKSKDTGVLNPQERAILAASAKPLQDEVGWRFVQDQVSGARVGLPGKLATETSRAASGTRWSSAQGQLQIETFRVSNTRLEAVFDREKREPFDRRSGYNLLRPDFFVISGTQGLKKFYVRAFLRDGEVRGLTIIYDQAMEGTMDPVVVAMSSAFVPFATFSGQDGGSARRKVEYGTGLVVSGAGHIVTDKQTVDGCQIITIPGLGHAERLAEDNASELALLRVYGARDLTPIGLLGAPPRGDTVTLLGIADPQTQGGGAAISSVAARVAGNRLDAAPAPGFSGGAAIDGQGRPYGMMVLRTPMVAGPAQSPQASVVPRERLMNFLEANYIAPSSGSAGVDAAKTAVVRVICVRR